VDNSATANPGKHCQVCIDRLAVTTATHQRTGATWRVCGSCRNQGIKHKARVDYEGTHAS
jgi:hypothetical protein